MSESINRFYSSIKDAKDKTQGALIEFFVYYLTVEIGQVAAAPSEVDQCFIACDLSPPKGTSVRLAEGVRTRPQKYIKVPSGYKLHRHRRETLSQKLGAETTTVQTSATLRSLEGKLPQGLAKAFLNEALDCFEIGANRATIVMTWILTINHLYDFILSHKLSDFNVALAKNTDKRVKVSKISHRDEFSEIPEGKFIELCRSSGIISNDVRKILEQKLGTRNTSAHPSGVKISRSKVIDFVEDLVENIILKYRL